jgi:hypothetical protein
MRVYTPLLGKNKQAILENVKQAKQYVQVGKLSEDNLKKLIEIDPTPTRKFVGWMAKMWITEKPDLGELKNAVEKYNTFLKKGKAKTQDIYQFKTFKELQSEVDDINKSGGGVSIRDLESDYEVVVDNADLLIISPHTHEASRKLGLSHFAFRDCEGGKDSAWCTTYKAPDEFHKYYYKLNITLYYVKVKSPQMILKLKKIFSDNWQSMVVTALLVYPNGKIEGFDGLDMMISKENLTKYINIVGIS